MACRTPNIARNTSVLAAALYLCVGLIPVTIGLLGAHLVPGLDDPEQVIPRLAREHLHVAAQVMLLGALVSAILSTVDSNLLSASALLSHNVVLRWWPAASERRKVLTARVTVVLVGLLAYMLAVTREGVYALVEEASAFGGGGMAVAMVFGLLGGFGGAHAALAAMATSMAVQIGGTYVWPITAPMATSCVVSFGVYVAVALRERAHS
jgi:Na+/proline symporter